MSVYLSSGGEGAGAWLHAPTDEILPLSNEHFTIAAKLRLNKAQRPNPTHCQRHTDTRACNEPVNAQLFHALSCPFGPYRTNRHNAIRDALAKLIRKITGHEPLIEQDIPTQAHPTGQHHSDDVKPNNNRSDITWHTATQPVHLDVMVTSAFTKAALAGNHATSISPGYANSLAEKYKRRNYAPHPIVPIVFEAHGRFGAETLNFLRKLANTLPEPEQNPMYHYAVQLLSTTLQHYNARTIQAHLANHTDPHHQHAVAPATV